METFQIDRYISFKEEIQIQFYEILKNLGNIDCSYLSYTIEDRSLKKRISFFSHQDWNLLFKDNNFRDSCLLCYLCQTQGDIIIPWNYLLQQTPNNQIVMDARYDHDIANGITLSFKHGNIHEMIAFGSRVNNTNFINDDYMKNINIVNNSIQELRQLTNIVEN